MKKIAFLFTVTMLFFILISSAAAQDQNAIPETINPKTLLGIVDSQIFIKKPDAWDFPQPQGIITELDAADNAYLHQYYVGNNHGVSKIFTLVPSEKEVMLSNKRTNFDNLFIQPEGSPYTTTVTMWKKDFHLSYTVELAQASPDGKAMCWVSYSNHATVGEAARQDVYFRLGDRAYQTKKTPDGMETTELFSLADYAKVGSPLTIDVVRLNGVTYFYIGHQFIQQFEDGIAEAVSFDSGSLLLPGGDNVQCEFSSFSLYHF